MWIFFVGDSGGKDYKNGDVAPPIPVTQRIQLGNPPPLLDLINQHSLAIFSFGIHSITYIR